MDIKMAGIDYNKASVEVRELFAMTKSAASAAMRQIQELFSIEGCVVISTCNRTELWISGGGALSPREALCALKGADADVYSGYFLERSGEEAVSHLFELACGLKSQVFGEDQIITQIKDSAALARESGCAGAVLENLFRTAVTAAKEVKTAVRLTGLNRSVAASTIAFLQEQRGILSGLSCMVIGNGEMGRLAASALVSEGCRVQMTVRRYHHGEVAIPKGVTAISYEERLKHLQSKDIIVSATTSPHYTLHAEEMPEFTHPVTFCDLAVPRDIDPEISQLAHAAVYDTDDICGGQVTRGDAAKLETARRILRKYVGDFESWYGFRELVPIVNEIRVLAAEDMMSRVGKSIRRLTADDSGREQLEERIQDAAGKVVGRLMFGLRDNLDPALWKSCLAGLQKSARGEEHE